MQIYAYFMALIGMYHCHKYNEYYDPHKTQYTKQELKRLVGIVANKFEVTSKNQSAIVNIALYESHGNPKAANRKSSAYGLYQFLDRTWVNLGVRKTNCPYCQTEAAIRYIQNRYGVASRALAFRKQRGYY